MKKNKYVTFIPDTFCPGDAVTILRDRVIGVQGSSQAIACTLLLECGAMMHLNYFSANNVKQALDKYDAEYGTD